MNPVSFENDNQVGLGVDVVEIDRVATILKRTPAFVQRVFTSQEIDYCKSQTNPATHFAMRFAAKEAISKALGTGFSDGIKPIQIEIAKNAKGRPYVILHNRAKALAKEQNIIELPVSLSYTHTEAVACVMALTKEADIQVKKQQDSVDNLAQRFKEARLWLDDIDKNSPEGK